MSSTIPSKEIVIVPQPQRVKQLRARSAVHKREVKAEVKRELKKDMTAIRKEGFKVARKSRRTVTTNAKNAGIPKNSMKMASYIVAPRTQAPIRLPLALNDNKTAVSAPWTIPNVGWAANDEFDGQLASSEMMGVLFRDASRNYITYDANNAGATATYEFQGADSGTQIGAPFNKVSMKEHAAAISASINRHLGAGCLHLLDDVWYVNPISINAKYRLGKASGTALCDCSGMLQTLWLKIEQFIIPEFRKVLKTMIQSEFRIKLGPQVSSGFVVSFDPDTYVDLMTPYAICTSSYQPHGSIMFGGTVKSQPSGRYFWLDQATTVTLTGTVAAAAFPVTISLYLNEWSAFGYEARKRVDIAVVLDTDPVEWTVPIPESGYYSLTMISNLAAELTVASSGFTGNKDFFGHHCIPGLENNGYAANALRITAASLMYSNNAPLLNLQGKVSMVQLSQGTNWMNFIGQFSLISKATDAVTMSIEKGIYGWIKPTQTDDFNFTSNIVYNQTGDIIDSTYPIDNPLPFLLCYAQVALASGQDGYWTISDGVEYITTDNWRPTGKARGSEAEINAAFDFLKAHVQFTENANHLTKLANGLKNFFGGVFKGIETYGPRVMSTAKALSSVLEL
jgi:hypothetical protein